MSDIKLRFFTLMPRFQWKPTFLLVFEMFRKCQNWRFKIRGMYHIPLKIPNINLVSKYSWYIESCLPNCYHSFIRYPKTWFKFYVVPSLSASHLLSIISKQMLLTGGWLIRSSNAPLNHCQRTRRS